MGEIVRIASAGDQRHLIESLRARYESGGFNVVIDPEPLALPRFMGSYRPDAIATKPGLNIAVAVKGRQSMMALSSLQQIGQLFEGRTDWQFDIIFAGHPAVLVPIAPAQTILDHRREITGLCADGHKRAALVMAWSLLEAAFHSIQIAENKPRSVEGVLQALAGEGYVEPNMERRLQPLVSLRNRIVHGDMLASPTDEDVALLLAAVEKTLAADLV